MLGSLLVAPLFLYVMVFSRTAGAAIAAFLVYNLFAYAWAAPTIRLIQDTVEVRERALATALCSAVGIFIGLGIGIPSVGWISDRLSSAYGPRSIGIALGMVVPFGIAVGFSSHLLILKRLADGPAVADLDKSASRSAKSKEP
jgi:Na+/H+ antiporter NhaA